MIGILGFGYLGKELLKSDLFSEGSWYTKHQEYNDFSSTTFPNKSILFDWVDPTTWNNLPLESCPLVLSIPPLLEDRLKEQDRLRRWCQWMVDYRGRDQKLIYISSTGVYPDKDGFWCEDAVFEPDTLKGGLRYDSERLMAEYFDLKVIRSGAIYGRKRNIGQRILDKKPIPKGKLPIHRIHVIDLAGVVRLALTEETFPTVVNAVDLDATSSQTVAEWLVKQAFFPFKKNSDILLKDSYFSRKFSQTNFERKISNNRLLKECRYRFLYPTYKEGLREAFDA